MSECNKCVLNDGEKPQGQKLGGQYADGTDIWRKRSVGVVCGESGGFSGR